MDATDVYGWIRQPNINLEVSNAAEEIGCVQIPALVVGDIWRTGDNTQAYEA